MFERISVKDDQQMSKIQTQARKLMKDVNFKKYFLYRAINNLKIAEMDLLMCKPEAASLVNSLVTVLLEDSVKMKSVNKDKEVNL